MWKEEKNTITKIIKYEMNSTRDRIQSTNTHTHVEPVRGKIIFPYHTHKRNTYNKQIPNKKNGEKYDKSLCYRRVAFNFPQTEK